MAIFFLDYDLRNKRDYQDLYDELASFNAVRILDSSWCFKRFETNASNLIDYFSQFIDSDDGLSIAEVKDWSTLNVVGTPNDLT